MGMPAIVEIIDRQATRGDVEAVFDFFTAVDEKFSTYKPTSEVSEYNAGRIAMNDLSQDMRTVLRLAAETKGATNGFFDIERDGRLDPSGLVKGWAIDLARQLLHQADFKNFYLEIAGDIQVSGHDDQGKPWHIGIRHPTERDKVVKVVQLTTQGIATSGTSERGQHIYNPKTGQPVVTNVVSLSVIGPNIYEADRFATAAFAMGHEGIAFIERRPGLEGYSIDRHGTATMTSGWNTFVTST